MPCVNIQQAIDEVFAIVLAAWGTNGPIQWPDMTNPDVMPEGSWLRVTLRHQLGSQASLADASSKKRWMRYGTMWLQVFTQPGQGTVSNIALVQQLMTAFEGVATPGGVWFRNVRLNEIGPSGGYTQNNVLVEFTYDEIH